MIRRTTSRKNDKVVHFMVQNPEYDNFMSHKVTSIIFRWKQIQAYPIPIDLLFVPSAKLFNRNPKVYDNIGSSSQIG